MKAGDRVICIALPDRLATVSDAPYAVGETAVVDSTVDDMGDGWGVLLVLPSKMITNAGTYWPASLFKLA